MNLHIELDSSHSSYEWLEKQADKIVAKGHIGTHIDCYTKSPEKNNYYLPTVIIDCCNGMLSENDAFSLPMLEGKALVLYTGNLHMHGYGESDYFKADTIVSDEVLNAILAKKPSFILIDSFGIGSHGADHIGKDKRCEASNCFVIENINITPELVDRIGDIQIEFDLDYPSSGKPCRVTF